MAANAEWKTGDTWPPIAMVAQKNGEPRDISTADEIRMIASMSGTVVFEGTMGGGLVHFGTVDENGDVVAGDGTDGGVYYLLQENDLDVAMTPEIELEVTLDDASTPPKIETYPNNKNRNPKITVTDDL